MSSRHIAIFTLPGNGHVYPTLPLCSELVKRGYRVTCATTDQYAAKIAHAGATPVPYKGAAVSKEWANELRRKFSLPCDDPKWWEMSECFRKEYFGGMIFTVSQVQKYYEEDPPDLMLYDRGFEVARILAKRIGVPTAQIAPHFACVNGMLIRKNGICQTPNELVEEGRALDAFLLDQGITDGNSLLHVENLNIHFLPREFQYNIECFDERYCFVGPLLERPAREALGKSKDERKAILISGFSGTNELKLDTDSFFSTVIDALADSEFRCILSVDERFSGSSKEQLPNNFVISRGVSHLDILSHVDLLLCHGGMRSTLESIYSGVPVLLIPVHPGCDEVAYRTMELGLGARLLKHDLTIERIVETVRGLIENNVLRNRVEEMARIFSRAGGTTMAADALERVFLSK